MIEHIVTTLQPAPVIKTVLSVGQGPAGPQGPAGIASTTKPAAVNLSGHRAVYINGSGQADYASADSLVTGIRVIGITTGAASSGADATVQTFGDLTEPSWNWNTNLPVFLGLDGYLTQTNPTYPASLLSVVIGYPVSPTRLFININTPIAIK